MITRLSGTVWSVGEDAVVVQVGGVGLQVSVPANLLAGLKGPGQAVDLFTYLSVRENDLSLYGFLSQEALSLFKLLLSVSGVGPKVALALLGSISPQVLRQAILKEDPGQLTPVPGIGKKTAKAIIFHLKDKMIPAGTEVAPLMSDTDAEVVAALTSLGFSLVEAQAALQSLTPDEGETVEERVRQALATFAAS